MQGLYGDKRKDLTEHKQQIKNRTKTLIEADKDNKGRKQLRLPLEGKI